MEFRLLGPIDAVTAQGQVRLGGPKPRAALAALLLARGRVVAASRLIDVLWGDAPPDTAKGVLQTHLANLRREIASVGGPSIESQPPGYRLALGEATLDLDAVEQLSARADAAASGGDYDRAASQCVEALGFWRGPSLSGVADGLLNVDAVRLDELYLQLLERRFSYAMQAGGGGTLIGELTSVVAEHPLRERLRGSLMRALARAGRRAEALEVFRTGRLASVAELGLEPGAELSRIHQEILRADPADDRVRPDDPRPSGTEDAPVPLVTPPPRPPQGDGTVRLPRQLPVDIGDFTARADELRRLRTALRPDGSTVPVVVVCGAAGVGKSALAVRAAHDASEYFPDGQLYVDLRGADAQPVRPHDVLARFLRALGLPPGQVPEDADERAGLFRTLVADRRVLICLDNAHDERQIRPLMPGGVGCAVLVTSRRPLAALAAATRLELSTLAHADALALLSAVVGDQRVAAQSSMAQRLVEVCGGLPLALRIVGARLARRPDWTLTDLVRRLDDERRRLDELRVGDLEVRGSLNLSRQQLTPLECRALRRLALHGGTDFPGWTVGPLAGVSPAVADLALETLVDCQLVEVAGVDSAGQARYRLHDLVRAFGVERAEAEEEPDDLRAALGQLALSWLAALEEAARCSPTGVLRVWYDIAAPVAIPESVVEVLRGDPIAWFEAERSSLVDVVEQASAAGLETIACALAGRLLSSSFAVRNQFDDWLRTHEAALRAARAAGNDEAEAVLLVGLGQLAYEQDCFEEASSHLTRAAAMFDQVANGHARAVAGTILGAVRREQARYDDALAHLRAALPVLEDLDDVQTTAHVVYGLGCIHLERGEIDEAATLLRRAVAHFRSVDSRRGEAFALRALGLVHRAAGDLPAAVRASREAWTIFRELRDDLGEAYAAQALAKAEFRFGRPEAARELLESALATCRRLQDVFGEALVLRTRGEWHLTVGVLPAARADLDRALDLWNDLGLPVWQARTWRDQADLFEASGEDAQAAQLRDAAYTIMRGHGAREADELASQYHFSS